MVERLSEEQSVGGSIPSLGTTNGHKKPMFEFIWIEIFFKPIFNSVVFFYNISPGPNLGWAVIGLAIFVRFIFLPFTLIGYKQDEKLLELRPEIEKIEEDKSLTSKEKIQKVSQLTKPLGINPIYSAIPLFAQILVLGVLYQIIQGPNIINGNIEHLYPFIKNPGAVNVYFFGIDLTKSNILLSAITSFIFFLERVWEYREKKAVYLKTFSQKWDPLIWPIGTFIILLILPSAKAIFVACSVIFSMVIKAIIHSRR